MVGLVDLIFIFCFIEIIIENVTWVCSDEIRYHVPRSFFRDGVNTIVLFEEFGGNPSRVNFQTVSVGTACGNAQENKILELSCQGRPISEIKFASFGNPEGVCGTFRKGSCDSKDDALTILRKVSS